MSGHMSLTRYARISVAAALLVLALKFAAWWLTGSVGLLSDALETLTNVAGALVALYMLRVAQQPPDDAHTYGHGKAEYFAGGFEGMLIFFAAGLIAFQAVPRLWAPQPLEQAPLGLAVAAAAAVINLAVARLLMRVGRAHHSITLQADARHLMADVWTTVGVVAGVAAVAATGRLWLDPLAALVVAGHVLSEGVALMRGAAAGLMDAAWPQHEQKLLARVLDEFRGEGVDFHAVRTRTAAAQRFVSLHVLVPGQWTVQQGHDLAERIEQRLAESLANVSAETHVEPAEDPRSYDD
ncbi:MAG: cation transporter [Nevskia sp.]|nr:cation transporter [Nevskia sp.]